jgi:hypothetical protein
MCQGCQRLQRLRHLHQLARQLLLRVPARLQGRRQGVHGCAAAGHTAGPHLRSASCSAPANCCGISTECLTSRTPHDHLSRPIPADIDECAEGTAVCHANAACVNAPGNYTCKCKPGYAGDGVASCLGEARGGAEWWLGATGGVLPI